MVALFLVDAVGTGCNVSGNNDYCWVLSIVEIFHIAFLGQVLGIHINYYVSMPLSMLLFISEEGKEL